MKLINSRMTVTIVLMNPELAKKILSLNIKNRKVNESSIASAVHKMKTNKWHENGESIIIGIDGRLKDGQHRLQATIRANHQWKAVLVTGVDSKVMSSIDTGKNRSASDVLTLNGYSYGALKASLSKLILMDRYSRDSAKRTNVCNQTVLDYVSNNNDMLNTIISITQPLYKKQSTVVFTSSFLPFLLTKIAGNNIANLNSEAYRDFYSGFLKMLCGVVVSEDSAACWVRSTILKNKNKGNSLQMKWIYNAVIKSWNLYIDGNIPVRSLRVTTDKLEQPKQLVF